MTRAMSRMVLVAALMWMTTAVSLAQTTAIQETKAFEVLAISGSQLVVRFPEGTREVTVPADFRFNVNGQMLSLQQLKVGMKGTAAITTRTTVTPVTVTEVKNGTVAVRSGSTLIVRTDNDVKMFTQDEIDKRGIRIFREGQPAQLSQFREGDRITATIITAAPPKVVTEKEVEATLAASKASASGAAPAGATATTAKPAATTTTTAKPAAAPAASSTAATSAPAARTTPAPASQTAPTATSGRTLPATASSWPLVGLTSAALLAMGLALTIRRRFAR
jgi:hypothetical protein